MTNVEVLRNFNLSYDIWLNQIQRRNLPFELGYPAIQFLATCANFTKPVRVTDVVNTLQLDSSYASRLVKQLVTIGYLTTKPLNVDGRAKELIVTSFGQELIAGYFHYVDKKLTVYLAKLSTKELEQLQQSIEVLQTFSISNVNSYL